MPDVHDAPKKRHPRARIPFPLDFTDPATVAPWLAGLHEQIDDAVAAGEDATRAPSRRDLGRRLARRILLEARASLASFLAEAERALAALPARSA